MSGRRARVPVPKPGLLEAKWGRPDSFAEPSVVYVHGGGAVTKSDSRMLCGFLEEQKNVDGRSLVEELEARGFDLATLRFSIAMKAPDDGA